VAENGGDGELRFTSKTDWWMPVMIAIAIGSAPVAIWVASPGKAFSRQVVPVLAIGLLLPVGLLVWMWFTTLYSIAGNELRIACGPMKMTVPIDSISRIRSSHSLVSSPALSLSRLAIQYGRFQEVLISPADRRGFILAIVERVPHVVLEDLDEYR
jgi:hypothetical protein